MMTEDFPKMSPAELEKARQVLGSAEGKRLIALLSRSDGLQQAAAEFKKGNTAGAQALLRPLVSTPEAAELLEKIGRK